MTMLVGNKKSLDASSGQWGRLARVISEVFNPPYVALPTFLVIALVTAPDIFHALLWWIVTVFGTTLAPLLFVFRGVRRGQYSDHHVSVREQRFIPLLFGIGSVAIAFVLLYALGASRVLMVTVTSVIIVLVIGTVITQAWKISLHLMGAAGAVTVCVLLFGPLLLLLLPLVALVGWARWQVHAHTLLQALAGATLSVSVTVAIFWLFSIL